MGGGGDGGRERQRRVLAGGGNGRGTDPAGDHEARWRRRALLDADGRIELGLGDIDNPDATITQSYETAVALAKREANPVTSFMMGKIKIDGNMGMLMGLAGALGKLADGMSTLDVEY